MSCSIPRAVNNSNGKISFFPRLGREIQIGGVVRSLLFLPSSICCFTGQSRSYLQLAKNYQEELCRCSGKGIDLFDSYQKVYDFYQEKYRYPLVERGIEEFNRDELPSLRHIERFGESVCTTYDEAYPVFMENRDCFHAYSVLSHEIGWLLRETQTERALNYCIQQYKKIYSEMKLDIVKYQWCEEGAACYRRDERSINFPPDVFESSPSEQAFTVLHEIRHSMQEDPPSIFDDYLDVISAKRRRESDADTFAASQISCELCLRVKQYSRKRFPAQSAGYFQPQDFIPFIAKRREKRCEAHRCDTTSLEQAMEKNDFAMVREIDRQMGDVFQRLGMPDAKQIVS